ncbi:MAG: hypothetical protein DBX55_09680 [Verrucomicrobia bacterium]|nr:MAG: hypothetical protein DBX55_09680 [Verrucomicrobiota bacterium]
MSPPQSGQKTDPPQKGLAIGSFAGYAIFRRVFSARRAICEDDRCSCNGDFERKNRSAIRLANWEGLERVGKAPTPGD